MRKFKFETGEIIECSDEAIIKLILDDNRYSEVKKDKSKPEIQKDDKSEVKKDEDKPEEGETSDEKVQK